MASSKALAASAAVLPSKTKIARGQASRSCSGPRTCLFGGNANEDCQGRGPRLGGLNFPGPRFSPWRSQTRTMHELWRRAHNDDGEMVDLELATQACAIAREVAPYLHPRLAAIAATATVTTVERSSPEKAS